MKRPEDDVRGELEDLSPRLLHLKERGEGFNVPEGYFQHLQNEVLEKIQQQARPKEQKRWWVEIWESVQVLFQPRWALSLASIATIVTLGALWLFQHFSTGSSNLSAQLAKVDQETLSTYVQDNLHQFDTETLMEFANSTEEGANFEGLSPEELNQYLDEVIQDMDSETLKELL